MAWLRDSRAPAGALGFFIHDPVADANRLISGSPSGTQRATTLLGTYAAWLVQMERPHFPSYIPAASTVTVAAVLRL